VNLKVKHILESVNPLFTEPEDHPGAKKITKTPKGYKKVGKEWVAGLDMVDVFLDPITNEYIYLDKNGGQRAFNDIYPNYMGPVEEKSTSAPEIEMGGSGETQSAVWDKDMNAWSVNYIYPSTQAKTFVYGKTPGELQKKVYQAFYMWGDKDYDQTYMKQQIARLNKNEGGYGVMCSKEKVSKILAEITAYRDPEAQPSISTVNGELKYNSTFDGEDGADDAQTLINHYKKYGKAAACTHKGDKHHLYVQEAKEVWYLRTKEGIDKGPFDSEAEAKSEGYSNWGHPSNWSVFKDIKELKLSEWTADKDTAASNRKTPFLGRLGLKVFKDYSKAGINYTVYNKGNYVNTYLSPEEIKKDFPEFKEEDMLDGFQESVSKLIKESVQLLEKDYESWEFGEDGSMSDGFKVGDLVYIDPNQREELTIAYKDRHGMSGVEPNLVNAEYIIKDFDGSNVIASVVGDDKRTIHLNRSRFKKS